jgi:hypothetical protein
MKRYWRVQLTGYSPDDFASHAEWMFGAGIAFKRSAYIRLFGVELFAYVVS